MKTDKQIEAAISKILVSIGEDPTREGLLKTPYRVAKSFSELYSGYNQNALKILQSALFETTNNQMVLVKDIEFYSMCEHHMLPIIGKAHVAYIPNGKVVGLSKIPRVVDVYAKRLQIQEQLTEQIADAINEALSPIGVGVVIDARHMCMEMRGVGKVHSSTTTSALRGVFLEEAARKEFLTLINSKSHS